MSGAVLLEDEDGAPYPEDVQAIVRERDDLLGRALAAEAACLAYRQRAERATAALDAERAHTKERLAGLRTERSNADRRAGKAQRALAAVERALDDEEANLADDGARLSHAVVRRLRAVLAEQPTLAAGGRVEGPGVPMRLIPHETTMTAEQVAAIGHQHTWTETTDYASGPNLQYACINCPATKEEPRP